MVDPGLSLAADSARLRRRARWAAVHERTALPGIDTKLVRDLVQRFGLEAEHEGALVAA
jgi:hypothetical protein